MLLQDAPKWVYVDPSNQVLILWRKVLATWVITRKVLRHGLWRYKVWHIDNTTTYNIKRERSFILPNFANWIISIYWSRKLHYLIRWCTLSYCKIYQKLYWCSRNRRSRMATKESGFIWNRINVGLLQKKINRQGIQYSRWILGSNIKRMECHKSIHNKSSHW